MLGGEEYWSGWFSGLNDSFLDLTCSKIFIIAGVAHLEKALTVAHMQGKFQLEVINKTGHIVHEDQSHEVAGIFLSFFKRYKVLLSFQPLLQ